MDYFGNEVIVMGKDIWEITKPLHIAAVTARQLSRRVSKDILIREAFSLAENLFWDTVLVYFVYANMALLVAAGFETDSVAVILSVTVFMRWLAERFYTPLALRR